MTRWTVGSDEIERLLTAGELQRLTSGAGNGYRLLERSTVTLASAREVVDGDPDSAFILAYDAARHSLTALLARQGLRPTTKGGHYAVERAARAQFGDGVRHFGALRRRRNELEYPGPRHSDADTTEAREAIERAQRILAAAQQLIGDLSRF